MITWKDLYTVLTAVVPLYAAMILAYGSVKWWKIFSPDQCSGINRFVAIFAVPLLSFHFISTNNPYAMNLRFIAADTLQKVIILVALGLWAGVSRSGSLDWLITIFSLSTLPNTLVMGIPLLIAMYGPYSGSLMVQVVVLQCIIWYTLLLFLFEYRGAKLLILEQFPDTAASIVSFKVDSDVVSLDGREFLETDAEIGDDGKLHVTVRKSTSSRSVISSRRSFGGGLGSLPNMTPRPSNLTGAEIYSVNSSRNPTPRGSNFNTSDLYAMAGGAHPRRSNFGQNDMVYSLQSSRGPTPRPSNFDEPHNANSVQFGLPSSGGSRPGNHYGYGSTTSNQSPAYPSPNPEMSNPGKFLSKDHLPRSPPKGRPNHDAKELHMFVWSSSGSPISEVSHLQASTRRPELSRTEQQTVQGGTDHGAKEIRMLVADRHAQNGGNREAEDYATETFSCKGGATAEREEGSLPMDKDGSGLGKLGSGSMTQMHSKEGERMNKQMPPASVMTRLILIMVWRKLIRNPNTYSSLVGVIWSLIAFRWHVSMPKIIEKSISILSDAGLGMAMFSLGLFMALQPKIIACGNSVAVFAMAIRFLTGPAVMAAASIAIGLRGTLLRVAIVQAALPQGIVPFVFAKEYNVHPAILSTAVIFGMLIALPITLVYYILLGL